MKEDNLVADKSKAFAIRVIRLYQHLNTEKKEFVLSKQILRSGTSIGANVREAISAQSKADFIAKMQITLKEATETQYWLELLNESGYIENKFFEGIYSDCQEIISLLVAITKHQNEQKDL